MQLIFCNVLHSFNCVYSNASAETVLVWTFRYRNAKNYTCLASHNYIWKSLIFLNVVLPSFHLFLQTHSPPSSSCDLDGLHWQASSWVWMMERPDDTQETGEWGQNIYPSGFPSAGWLSPLISHFHKTRPISSSSHLHWGSSYNPPQAPHCF